MHYESPTIRPPSEWRSGLLRITRGCNWNRCRFCGIYPHLGQPDFSIRELRYIFHDIKLLHDARPDIDALFLGDADPLSSGMDHMLPVLQQLAATFSFSRLTTYARFSTLHGLGAANIHRLAQAAARDALGDAAPTWTESALRAMHAAFPEPEPNTWPACERLVTHARAGAAHVTTDSRELAWAQRETPPHRG